MSVPKKLQSKMSTELVTIEEMEAWKLPDGVQRDPTINDKVREVAVELKESGGILRSVITLGKIPNDRSIYLVDGGHRREACKLSGLKEFIIDVREMNFDSMADLAVGFVESQAHLKSMKPDDVLRPMELFTPTLAKIRKECPFVGYDYIRRSQTSPIVSMAMLMRTWYQAHRDIPSGGGLVAKTLAQELDEVRADHLIRFLNVCYKAWGRDIEYAKLWGALNLTICAWLYLRLVIDRDRGVKRYVLMNDSEFKVCLMGLSASPDYLDWLVGRTLGERDRSPCYQRVKAIFVKRMVEFGATGKKSMMPQPSWTS